MALSLPRLRAARRWWLAHHALLLLLLLLLVEVVAMAAAFSVPNKGGNPHMVYRVYSGEDGQSHVEPMFLDMEPFVDAEGAYGQATALLESPGIIFRSSPAGYRLDWHTAPRRQLMILLKGRVEIEVGGESGPRQQGMKKLQCGPGDVVLAEDTTGQGHITRVVGNEDRFYAIVPLADDALVRRQSGKE